MKILVVGATGTIGSGLITKLDTDCHEVISAGLTSGDIQIDIAAPNSIKAAYEAIGPLDAVVSTTGTATFKALTHMKPEDYQLGLQNKLMGQVNLVLLGIPYMNEGGSFTLTSGCLVDDPIPTGSSASMANGGIHAFTIAAAIELPKRLRINCVNPVVIEESLDKYGQYMPGFKTVPARRAARAYIKSIEGAQTGQIYVAD